MLRRIGRAPLRKTDRWRQESPERAESRVGEGIKQRPATTLVISSKLVIWSSPVHLLIIDKKDHIWPYFPLLAQTGSTALPVLLGPTGPRCSAPNRSDRKYLEVEFAWKKGGYALSTHAQWKAHLPGISLISSSELNEEKRSSNHFRQTLYRISVVFVMMGQILTSKAERGHWLMQFCLS